ncbi:MAG: DUF4331 family protein [Polyangiaceae bacterium]
MRKHIKSRYLPTALRVAALCAVAGLGVSSAQASDHDEAPAVKKDAALDITDVYVFESAPGKTTIIVCWAGFNDSRPQPDDAADYANNALYTIWIDNDGDGKADKSIYWRYGKNAAGNWGVQFENVPGTELPVSGPVETVFPVGTGARAWSGHADDPFFFDAGGYLASLQTGNLEFKSVKVNPPFSQTDDFLKGFNVTAAAIEIDNTLLQNAAKAPIQVWATSARNNK